MPKFKIANKVYDISADQVNKFKALAQTKGYKIEEVLEQQPIEVGQPEGKPQAVATTGVPATAQEKTPATESKSEPGLLESWGAQLGRGFANVLKGAQEFSGMLTIGAVNLFNPSMTKEEKEGLRGAIKYAGTGAPIASINASEKIINELSKSIKQYDDKSITEAISNKNYADAVEMTIGGALESAPSLLAAMTGWGGIAVIGGTSAGNKFAEEFEKNPEESTGILALNALGNGTIEALFERATLGISRYLKLSGTSGLAKDAAEQLAKQTTTTIFKKFGLATTGEGLSEAATTLTSKIYDSLTLDDREISLQDLPEIIDSGIIGAFTGGGLATVSAIGTNGKAARERAEYILSSPEYKQGLQNAAVEINKLVNAYNSDETQEGKEILKQKIEEIESKVIEAKKQNSMNLYSLEGDNLKNYALNIDEINKSSKILNSDKAAPESKDLAEKRIKELAALNSEIIKTAKESRFAKNLETAQKSAEKQGIDFYAMTTAEVEAFELSKDKRKTKQSKIIAETADGYIRQYKDGRQEIVINTDIAKEKGAITVGSHELLHGILFNSLKSNPETAVKLGESLSAALTNIDSDQVKDSNLLKRLKLYSQDSRAVQAEELLALTSDAIATGDLQFDENIFTRIGDTIRRTLQDIGFKKIKFDTPKDVYNFIKDYNRDIKKGGIRKAIAKVAEEGATGKLVSGELTQEQQSVIKKSITPDKKAAMMDKYNAAMQGIERTQYTRNNPLPTRLEGELVKEFQGYISKLVSSKFRQIDEEAITREDAEMTLLGEALSAIRTFNPAKNDDIAGYVASILARRQSMIFEDVKKEFTEDVETASKVIAEETETEIMKKEKEIKKKENFSDALDLSIKVDNIPITDHVSKAVSKNARLSIKKITEQVSSNRTVTPFVQTLKEELAEDLRKVMKSYINAYPGGYEGFLKANKEVILNNLTTTYLSKHPLFKKGVQKSIGGEMALDNQGNKFFKPKWVSPVETDKGYNWVNANGNPLERGAFDRDNAGARGMTSGPEFIRRNPKINEVITEAEFVDYHFQDGAQRKKKKQNPEDALARQLASEYGFEVLKNDLNNQGEIYNALSETADLFDIILAETEMQKIAKDIDRGTVKFSKSIPKANFTSDANAIDILSKSLLEIAKGDPKLAEAISDEAWVRSFPKTFKEIILPSLSDAVAKSNTQAEKVSVINEFLNLFSRPIRTVSYQKSLDINLSRNAILLRTIKNVLADSDKKLIGIQGGKAPIRLVKVKNYSAIEINNEKFNVVDFDITHNKIKQSVVNGEISKNSIRAQNTAAMGILKKIIFDTGKQNPGLALSIIKLMQKDNRSVFRTAALLNATVKNYTGELVYEHNPPTQYVYEKIQKFLENPSAQNEAELNDILNSWEANIVPKDFAEIVDKDPEAKSGIKKTGKRYDDALAKTNYKFDTTLFKFSKSDVDKLDSMLSRKTGLADEIGEVTASRLGKNKGKFKFFIPPSADDFMGLMYYFVGKGKQGEEDLKFIKDKFVDPFAKSIAAFESHRQNSLNKFRAFKKEIKKTPADLNKKNEYGFTNEQSARVYLWHKKQLSNGETPSVPGLTKTELSNLVKYVKNNPALLNFANNVDSLLSVSNGYPDVKENWWGTSMTIDIIDTLNDKARKEFLKPFNDNIEEIFGKTNSKGEITGPIANKLRAAYGDNYIEALSDILYRMKNGRGREFGKNRLANKFNNWISNAVGSIMFLNTRSALLQQVSLVNFINLSDNNPIAFAKAIASPEQYAADYLKLLNSDFLKQRRGGLAIDVNEDEIAKAAAAGGNSLSNIISVILKKGFVLTTWADSHAIASGGATFYRNRINTYVKQGMTVEEAEAKAFFEFKELAEESQQSSRPDKISQQQASSLGRIILAFANTPMQYARITKKAALDLINRRGDWKTNTSKLLYYGALQNIMFTYMQQALFALAFGDDEEDNEKDEDRYVFAANGMADGFLRGLGFGGAVAATAKNMVLEAIEQEQGRKDYDEVVWKALTLSPPLSSKIDKARSVARTFTWKQQREKIFTEGVSLDNPVFEAVGKTTSVLTNVPLDRVIRKVDNVTTPLRQDVEFWQAFALYMGYGKYELGLYETQNKKSKSKGGKSGKKVMPRYK